MMEAVSQEYNLKGGHDGESSGVNPSGIMQTEGQMFTEPDAPQVGSGVEEH